MRAWEEELDFRDLARADPAITARLDPAALAAVFDLDATVVHIDSAFDRLDRLVHQEEHAHA